MWWDHQRFLPIKPGVAAQVLGHGQQGVIDIENDNDAPAVARIGKGGIDRHTEVRRRLASRRGVAAGVPRPRFGGRSQGQESEKADGDVAGQGLYPYTAVQDSTAQSDDK